MKTEPKITIRLELSAVEGQLLLTGLQQLIQERESEARVVYEDCAKGAAESKAEADIFRLIRTATERQFTSAGARKKS